MPNPFDSTFELFGRRRGPLSECIHQAPFEKLVELILKPNGRLITLRAPRAGYGKTMLLTRLQERAKGSFLFVPVRLSDGRTTDPMIILEDLLTQLCGELPGGGGLTRLDIIVRQLFSRALAPLVYSGEIPCQDRDGAYASLRDRPVEAFDFHYEEATIAQWCRQQFDILGPRLANELHHQSGAGIGETSFWVQNLFAFASDASGQGKRLNGLMDLIFNDERHFRTKSNSQESLSALLSLLVLIEPLVLILDEVEGLASDPDSALRAAVFLSGLWEANPKLNIILSVNDDVWESSFKTRLPMGLYDRYEDHVIRLEELNEQEAQELILNRAGAADGALIWSRMSENKQEFYPRFLLKTAREHWEVIQKEKTKLSEASRPQYPSMEPSRPQNADPRPAIANEYSPPNPFENQQAPPVFNPPHAVAPQMSQEPVVSPFTKEKTSSEQPRASYPPYQTPFSTSAATKPTPQEEIQDSAQQTAPNPFSPFAESSMEPSPSPFQRDSGDKQLGQNDKDTVDDLLRQFRERNGEA